MQTKKGVYSYVDGKILVLTGKLGFPSCFQPCKMRLNTSKRWKFTKFFGFSSLVVFQLIIFTRVPKGAIGFVFQNSERRQSLPGKDVIYRFLNHRPSALQTFS